MKDLRFSYTDKNGKVIQKEYDTIMDFTDSVGSGKFEEDMNNTSNVKATFFENPLNSNSFNSVSELYTHCCNIMK